MMSRLVMQDTEQIAADKALAAAIQAASTNLSPQTNSGNSNNEEAGKWSKVKSGGADRGGADQAGDKRRKVRMEKGRQTGKGKANDIGGVGYYGVLGEDKKDMTKAGDVDEDAYVKELLAGGAMDGRKAGPVSQHKNGKLSCVLEWLESEVLTEGHRNRRQYDGGDARHAPCCRSYT